MSNRYVITLPVSFAVPVFAFSFASFASSSVI